MIRKAFPHRAQKTCVVILGQFSVGKLEVGQELSRRTGFEFLHHRVVHDLVASVWGREMAGWDVLRQHFRHRILEKAVSSGAEGFIFSCIWDFDNETHRRGMEQAREIVASSGWGMAFVELTPAIRTRVQPHIPVLSASGDPLSRVAGDGRGTVHRVDLGRFNSRGDFPYPHEHVLVSRDDLSVEAIVDRIIVRFDLRTDSGISV